MIIFLKKKLIDIKIIYDQESKKSGQPIKTSDNMEIKKYMPYIKFTNLSNGLYRTIDYFVKNYDTIRK